MNPTKSDLITMILCELLHTEQAYVTDLKHLEETLDKVKRVHANDKHVDALIADSKKLLSFQTRFLNKLEEKCRMQALSLFLNPDLDEEEESNAAELEFDGSIFCEFKDEFIVYSDYCASHNACLKNLKSLEKEKEVKPLFKEMKRNSTKKLEIRDYLIKPIQRICRYPLFLNQLIKLASNPTIVNNLNKAKTMLRNFTNSITFDDNRGKSLDLNAPPLRKRHSLTYHSHLKRHSASLFELRKKIASSPTFHFPSSSSPSPAPPPSSSSIKRSSSENCLPGRALSELYDPSKEAASRRSIVGFFIEDEHEKDSKIPIPPPLPPKPRVCLSRSDTVLSKSSNESAKSSSANSASSDSTLVHELEHFHFDSKDVVQEIGPIELEECDSGTTPSTPPMLPYQDFDVSPKTAFINLLDATFDSPPHDLFTLSATRSIALQERSSSLVDSSSASTKARKTLFNGFMNFGGMRRRSLARIEENKQTDESTEVRRSFDPVVDEKRRSLNFFRRK